MMNLTSGMLRDLHTAEACMKAKLHTAVAVCGRRIGEAFARVYVPKETGTFGGDLWALPDHTQDLWEALSHCNSIGNMGAHPGHAVTREEAVLVYVSAIYVLRWHLAHKAAARARL